MHVSKVKKLFQGLAVGCVVILFSGCEGGGPYVGGSVYYDSMLWNDYYYRRGYNPSRPRPPAVQPPRPSNPIERPGYRPGRPSNPIGQPGFRPPRPSNPIYRPPSPSRMPSLGGGGRGGGGGGGGPSPARF